VQEKLTPGKWGSKGEVVFTDAGIILAHGVGGRYLADFDQRTLERLNNAKIFSASKEMLALLISANEVLDRLDNELLIDIKLKIKTLLKGLE